MSNVDLLTLKEYCVKMDNKFKVGDRIKVLPNRYHILTTGGQIGTIINTEGSLEHVDVMVDTPIDGYYSLQVRREFLAPLNEQPQPLPKLDSGTKFDSEKIRLDLISPIAIEELARVLTYGAKKYAPYNWAKGIVFSRLIGATLRHLYAYIRCESTDPETGISHLAHAFTNLHFLLHFEKTRPDLDDRPKEIYEHKKL